MPKVPAFKRWVNAILSVYSYILLLYSEHLCVSFVYMYEFDLCLITFQVRSVLSYLKTRGHSHLPRTVISQAGFCRSDSTFMLSLVSPPFF